MRKYLYIFKSELLSNLQYISNILIGSVGYIIHIFIFMQLWLYLYQDESSLINGYTLSQMIWYVILTEVIWSSVGSRKLCKKISDDVKDGNIAYNLNKPYNYIGYALFNHLGQAIIKLVIFIIIGTSLGLIFLNNFPNTNFIAIIIVLISIFLAIIINSLIVISIGLFSFKIEDSSPFHWLYSKLILMFGTLFPIEFFPKIMQPFIKYSPAYVTSYGPAKLFVDFSLDKTIEILIMQILYVIITYSLAMFIYRKGVRKLNVNGG